MLGLYDAYLADLALWERRWTDADAAIDEGLARGTPARGRADPRPAVRQGTARTGGAGSARTRPPRRRRASATGSTARGSCSTVARRAAAEASAITPNADGWLALAEAEYERARGDARPGAWADAAATWERLERPPLAAYCRWREAEALVAAGALAHRGERAAQGGARRRGSDRSKAAASASSSCSPSARGSISRRRTPGHADGEPGLEEILGLTPREAEVLSLVARGYTNREIAATLVISVKTASVHVSHILRKLDAPNRLEAAAIAHRVSPD